jgi:hypothetical protein
MGVIHMEAWGQAVSWQTHPDGRLWDIHWEFVANPDSWHLEIGNGLLKTLEREVNRFRKQARQDEWHRWVVFPDWRGPREDGTGRMVQTATVKCSGMGSERGSLVVIWPKAEDLEEQT